MQQPFGDQDSLSQINAVLDGFFRRSIRDAAEIDTSYEHLWTRLYALIGSGGKRLRPRMTLLAYEAFGGTEPIAIAPIAAAQELLHFSLLIHDDIIDRDYIRYGVANIAGQYKLTYAQYATLPEDVTHYANAAALLGGDLMLSGAYQLIGSSRLSNEDKTMAQNLLSRGIFEVAGGELLDTELSFMPYSVGDALKVSRYKTAGYSFIAPLLTGAQLAGANKVACSKLREFAIHLGIAFQLKDDLLGVFGNHTQTGKSTVGDIIEGKRTYMIEKAMEVLSDAEKSVFMLAFGNAAATPLEIEAAKDLLETSGVRLKTEEKMTEYAHKAKNALSAINLSDDRRQLLEQLVAKVIKRSS